MSGPVLSGAFDTPGNPAPDLEEARRFLALLDPEAETFTFSTFWDPKDSPKPNPDPLAQIRTGSLDELAQWLKEMNASRAGVFVTVNRTDGHGRKKENIVGLRAVFQEADRGDEPELPVTPHIEVESSPGKCHRYVLVRDGVLDEFEAVQLRLVDDYGSDPNAKDRSRVLRLPGFVHWKKPSTPHLVRVLRSSNEDPIPWEDVKELFPPVVREGNSEGSFTGDLPPEGTPLENPAEIASALDFIPADLGYLDWLRVLMALHSTGAGLEAFEVADTWSRKGESYREKECQYRWNTFNRNRDNGVTTATLFRLARQNGWTGEYLLNEEILELVPVEFRRKLDGMLDRYGIAMIQGKAVVVYRELDNGLQQFVTRFTKWNDLDVLFKAKKVPVVKEKNGVQRIEKRPLVPIWLNHPARKTYSQVAFSPKTGMVAGTLSLHNGDVLNLYQGLNITPREGDWPLIRQHILEIWCNGDQKAYDYVIGWLARMFQKPYEMGHSVLLLKSGEGTGKNIIIDMLVRALGSHAVVCVKPQDLTGKFNDHLAISVLVFGNEATWGGNKDQEGALKGLVTDEVIPIERKFIPKFQVKNCTHIIMASNNDWPAPVGVGDRRFVVLEVSEKRKGDFDYFKALRAEIDSGGTEAVVQYLLSMDITKFNPRELPDLDMQEAKFILKLRGADSVTRWWVDCLYSGEIYLDKEIGYIPGIRKEKVADGWEDRAILVSRRDLYDAYQRSGVGGGRVESQTYFGKKLAELLRGLLKEARPTVGVSRVWSYAIPDLKQCRESVESLFKQIGPWHDEADQRIDVSQEARLAKLEERVRPGRSDEEQVTAPIH